MTILPATMMAPTATIVKIVSTAGSVMASMRMAFRICLNRRRLAAKNRRRWYASSRYPLTMRMP